MSKQTEQRPSARGMRYRRATPAFSAGLIIMAGALIAGLGLWALYGLYRDVMREAALQRVRDQGELIIRQFADQPVVRRGMPDDPGWQTLRNLLASLRQIEPDLEYVSVAEQEEILFHERARRENLIAATPVLVNRQLLSGPGSNMPVLTFTLTVPGPGGQERSVQAAIRRAAVQREESASLQLITSMFRLSAAIIMLAFLFAVLLVGWNIRHDAIRQRRRQAEEHLAFAGALADGIIHDLRNPLSSLRLDVQMLAREAERGADARPERMAELAGRALRTMEREDAVLREFLYVAKPDGRDMETIDFNGCVRESIDLVAARFEKDATALAVELAPAALPVTVYPVSLKRAVVNVLTNAREAAAGNGVVKVVTRSERGMAVLCVDDDGSGIEPSERERIFDMFYTTRPEGTGLGLSLARTAVMKSGGTISAGKAELRGARITIALPLAGPAATGG